ncbi:polyprenyl synthetase family protein [Caminibacter pacificus]|uniref:Farnesyl diphosphate synthase n=1 Tax=Caminibacter pacificus TaxID=1424653 RepID=A0AAJ4RBR3_9BACT|nr:polyprenyl synthetase family protein [Caminibacter pacificus]NPA87742.1 polyprenyl synthetase family protein [Campylobacterota bacterium]QCI29053.1 polyprenyl synthetase family protein [Caminibacter pacificus]ROR39129.1 farnesyl diphosphate synthase [Caminibacter pacificus]
MEEFIKNNLIKAESFHPYYEKALNEMLLAGGKRFRPKLLLSVVKAYNPLLLENAKYAAFALELIHTYSLIHDDLPAMDNADLRRGHPTLHKTYDEVTAILVGDALNTYAFEVLSKAPMHNDVKIELIKILAQNAGPAGMVLGQAIDCYFEDKKLNLEELKTLHLNKTAKLIAASLQMGAVIVNKPELAQKLYDFGLKLGLLFQIQDDLLDLLDSEETGKTTGVDTNKNTFVTLLGEEEAKKEADKLASELSNELDSFDENLKTELKKLLDNYLFRHKR